MEIRKMEITRPTTKRGRKGALKEELLSLKPNSNEAVVLKENQGSSAYQAGKAANLNISVHKLNGDLAGHIAVYSNGPRQ